jgi:hypothetical protein
MLGRKKMKSFVQSVVRRQCRRNARSSAKVIVVADVLSITAQSSKKFRRVAPDKREEICNAVSSGDDDRGGAIRQLRKNRL